MPPSGMLSVSSAYQQRRIRRINRLRNRKLTHIEEQVVNFGTVLVLASFIFNDIVDTTFAALTEGLLLSIFRCLATALFGGRLFLGTDIAITPKSSPSDSALGKGSFAIARPVSYELEVVEVDATCLDSSGGKIEIQRVKQIKERRVVFSETTKVYELPPLDAELVPVLFYTDDELDMMLVDSDEEEIQSRSSAGSMASEAPERGSEFWTSVQDAMHEVDVDLDIFETDEVDANQDDPPTEDPFARYSFRDSATARNSARFSSSLRSSNIEIPDFTLPDFTIKDSVQEEDHDIDEDDSIPEDIRVSYRERAVQELGDWSPADL